jgi:hypothetical protein
MDIVASDAVWPSPTMDYIVPDALGLLTTLLHGPFLSIA